MPQSSGADEEFRRVWEAYKRRMLAELYSNIGAGWQIKPGGVMDYRWGWVADVAWDITQLEAACLHE